MFKKKDDSRPQSRMDGGVIGAETRIEGNIRFSGGLWIDGEVKGNVEAVEGSKSTLFLSERARIEGRVAVGHFVANGTVVGPVVVEESLELQPKARIEGDVEYTLIEMHQGAVIEGRLIHRGSKNVELKLAASN